MRSNRNNRNTNRGGGKASSEVRAKKHLGQHFLTDLNIAARIAEAMSGGGDVLEVGCGMGVLTQFLLQRSDVKTWGVEIDGESIEYLHRNFPQFTPTLIEGDFLNMNLGEMFPEGVKVIGNFPYNISSQIFFKIIEYRDLVPECVGMVQKEVAVRIAEGPGSREYGILSVLLQAWYDILQKTHYPLLHPKSYEYSIFPKPIRDLPEQYLPKSSVLPRPTSEAI